MKKIDKSNYEIWLIDWLDGNLTDMQAKQVLQFLDENPDLKEEFGEIELFSLKPSQNQYPDKSRLKRSAHDLSQTQFEYLCIASIENDLTEDQQAELNQLIGEDPEKKKTFELIAMTRLIPANAAYPYKKRLFRKTVLQNVIRMSFIGLSAAAVIAIAFILYFTRTPDLTLKHESVSQAVDSVKEAQPDQKIAVKEPLKEIYPATVPVQKQNSKNTVRVQHYAQNALQSSVNQKSKTDSASNRTPVSVRKIKIQPDFDLKAATPDNLISLNYTPVAPPFEEDRSRFSRFIARNFREKFLKDKSQKDSPLKVYEIAKASVTGLNKLLGWEMALDERKDLNGQLKSVYFSSKILKFNAPVKNSESPR